MFRELLEMGPDGMDLYEVFGVGDYSRTYTCPWCGEEFVSDGDTLALIRYCERYGCGCVPESVIDAAAEEGIPDAEDPGVSGGMGRPIRPVVRTGKSGLDQWARSV